MASLDLKDSGLSQDSQVLRMGVISKIRSGDLEGAHRQAMPCLESLGSSSAIPRFWLKVSKLFCALDVGSYGIVKGKADNNNSEISDNSWVKMGLDIIKGRLRGLTKSLVPAAMAFALALQVVFPTKVEAGHGLAGNIAANSVVLAAASEQLRKDEENANLFGGLNWEIESQGLEKMPETLGGRLSPLRTQTMGDQSAQIKWEVVDLKRDPQTNFVRATFDVTNSSPSDIPIMSLSMSDASYVGCTVEPKDSAPEYLGDGKTPSHVPAGGKVTYSVNIARTQSPEIMFRTSNGEFHHMKLDLRGFDGVSLPFEPKQAASYSFKNTSGSEFELKVELVDGTEAKKITLENGAKKLYVDDLNRGLVIKPNQLIRLDLASATKDVPEVSIIAKKDGKENRFFLTSKEEAGVMDYFHKAFDKLMLSIRAFGERDSISDRPPEM